MLNPASRSSLAIASPKTPGRVVNAQILGSRKLLPLSAAHLPQLQLNSMSRAGRTLLVFSQRKGEKKGRSCSGARRVDAAAQSMGQRVDDRKASTASDGLRCRPIDLAPNDLAYKHQLHPQLWLPTFELCMSCYIGQQFRHNQPKLRAALSLKPELIG